MALCVYGICYTEMADKGTTCAGVALLIWPEFLLEFIWILTWEINAYSVRGLPYLARTELAALRIKVLFFFFGFLTVAEECQS